MNRYADYLPIVFFLALSLFTSCLPQEEEGDCVSSDLLAPILNTYNTATVDPLLGEPPYSYLWSTGATTATIDIPRSGGTFSVTVTDANGCTMDNSVVIAPWGCPTGLTTITDSDGNTYKVVEIGSQCWMAENLRVSGNIQQVTDDNQWENMSSPAWCYLDNSPTLGATYGKLYNWYAASGSNLCPQGWHIPNEEDWLELYDNLEEFPGQGDGGKMKVPGTTYWEPPNTGANNSSGFSGLPGLARFSGSSYSGFHSHGYWWSSTGHQSSSTLAWSYVLSYNNSDLDASSYQKVTGMSCRCVKD